MPPLRLRARWLLSVDRPPIEGGALLIDTTGRIQASGSDGDVPRPAGVAERDLGDAILMPGLVNTHSHAELTALAGLVADLPFREWIGRVRVLKDTLAADDLLASAMCGVLDAFAAGITTSGDTGSSGAPAEAMAALGARGVAYQEVFGPDPAQAAVSLLGLAAALERLAPHASERVTIGLSPHAPYTVSVDLLRGVAALAAARGAPVAMHLAESREETALVRDGTGPFADALRARGIAVHPHHCSSVAWARRGGLLGPRTLLIHCVEADADDIVAIASAGAAVAHCPTSNAELGHARMKLAAMRTAGVTVGLGTDSVATGTPLDLFREARLARDAAGLAPSEAVRMLTLGGAAALGLSEVGALTPGWWADLTVLDARGTTHPEEEVLNCAPDRVRAAWVAGREVYTDGRWPATDEPEQRNRCRRAGEAARRALSSSGPNRTHS